MKLTDDQLLRLECARIGGIQDIAEQLYEFIKGGESRKAPAKPKRKR